LGQADARLRPFWRQAQLVRHRQPQEHHPSPERSGKQASKAQQRARPWRLALLVVLQGEDEWVRWNHSKRSRDAAAQAVAQLGAARPELRRRQRQGPQRVLAQVAERSVRLAGQLAQVERRAWQALGPQPDVARPDVLRPGGAEALRLRAACVAVGPFWSRRPSLGLPRPFLRARLQRWDRDAAPRGPLCGAPGQRGLLP